MQQKAGEEPGNEARFFFCCEELHDSMVDYMHFQKCSMNLGLRMGDGLVSLLFERCMEYDSHQ